MAFLGWQELPGSVAHFRLWPRGRDLRRVSSGALRGGQNGGGHADAVAWLGEKSGATGRFNHEHWDKSKKLEKIRNVFPGGYRVLDDI